ncbi:hypothetical protein CYMTET_16620 [Cymbomonas tetramitiformis]|uniref:ADP-ribosylation factor-like protein 13B n=1 Tax=Cymbomonas tetramitiformis TaxID=36881 RepID=A0AAE0L7Y5_9CHLO|nr:hypothetical protein CYMTET_16620 [Cymbomonas tetramitiformis]|eukprot:gene9982-11818_t
MFGLAQNLYLYLKKRKERLLTLVLVGLDNAGKTTMLCNLRGASTDNITPTWGFSSENLVEGKCKMDIYDLGGGKNIRKIWERYYAEVHGAVFVVDANDRDRIEEARDVLHDMLRDPHLSGKPILIFANKQDLPKAMTAPEVAQALGLHTLQNLRHNIFDCTAKTPQGGEVDQNLKRGIKWIIKAVESEYAVLSQRVEKEAAAQRAEEDRLKAERKARVEAQRAERKREQELAEKGEDLEAQPLTQGKEEKGLGNPGPLAESIPSSLSVDPLLRVPPRPGLLTPIDKSEPEACKDSPQAASIPLGHVKGQPVLDLDTEDDSQPNANSLGVPDALSPPAAPATGTPGNPMYDTHPDRM